MGSLCRSTPQTTNTSSNSTQTYAPAAAAQMGDVYNRVAQAASQTYNPYQGQLVADLNPIQNAGINNINANAQAAQPYYSQALDYANQGASSITPEQIQQYQNPYQQQVINATQANFNETNQQQQSALRGNAALKGALGGDRAGIAQAELARQQNLAQAPVIANLNAQGYQSALGAAQADRAARAQGAFTVGSIGSAAQNAALQGGQAQIGAGSVAQQNQQQKLGADYQQYLNAQAFPYQQAQFLASYGLPALQAQGGTTTGQSTQTQTVQKPQASPFSQIMGAGLTAAGLFSGNPFMALGGASSMFGGGASGAGQGPIGTYSGSGNPWISNGSGMTWYADGGRVGHADGGVVSPFQMNYSAGGVADHFRNIRGMLRDHYAEGGVIPYGRGISDIESGGRYDALGPMLRGGRQALGKYQIMEENLPEWGRAAIGRPVTRDEFLKSPEIQDAIFNHRFGQYVKKYGPSGASRAWFAGEGGMNNSNARDALGTTVSAYENKFNRAMGIPQADRQKLAFMSQRASEPEMGSEEMIGGGLDPLRRRALALGIAMMTGGGGGFAHGGVVNKEFGGGMSYIPKNGEMPFAARAEGAFSPFTASQGYATPNERVQEGFEASEGAGSPFPSWYDQGANGSPFQMDSQDPPPPEGESQTPVETAGQPHDAISSQQRMDPYRVYQQNLPQGSSGDDMRSALIAAGLGMMAGKSSNALTNIAEGGLRGLGQYNINKKERQNAELAARRLMQQAEQFNQSLDLKNDQFNRQSEKDMRQERMFDRRLELQEKLAREREERQAKRDEERAAAAARREETSKQKEAEKPSAAERTVDAAFGKEYSTWVAGGGFNSTKQNLTQLNDVIKQLESGDDDISGPIAGRVPSWFHEKPTAVQERIAGVVQSSLKAILGGQFTEKEAREMINRAYNPKLSESENADRLKRLFSSMKGAAEMKQKAAQYYEENGTLKGFKGTADISLSDIERAAELDKKYDPEPKVGTVEKGHRYVGGKPGGRFNRENWEKI